MTNMSVKKAASLLLNLRDKNRELSPNWDTIVLEEEEKLINHCNDCLGSSLWMEEAVSQRENRRKLQERVTELEKELKALREDDA